MISQPVRTRDIDHRLQLGAGITDVQLTFVGSLSRKMVGPHVFLHAKMPCWFFISHASRRANDPTWSSFCISFGTRRNVFLHDFNGMSPPPGFKRHPDATHQYPGRPPLTHALVAFFSFRPLFWYLFHHRNQKRALPSADRLPPNDSKKETRTDHSPAGRVLLS